MNKGSVNIDDVQYFFPIENRDIDRFDVLSEFLYLKITSERLTSDGADGVFTQLGIFGTYAGTNKRRNENTISLAEFRMILKDEISCLGNLQVSISHTDKYATATAILEIP